MTVSMEALCSRQASF